MSEPELLELPDRAAWRRWLSRNHGRGRGVWLVIHKQGATTGSLTYEDAVREALCFGWIDSTAGSIDGERYRQWMAPRKPGSGWSATNKARVAELEAEGAIAAPGREAIERAKKNAGVTEARIVTYRRSGEYQNNIYSRVLGGGTGLNSLANMDLLSIVRGGSPQFMYLWMP